MNKPYTVIQKLAATSSRLEKEALLEAEKEPLNKDLFQGFALCYNSRSVFHIKKVPEATKNGPGLKWEDFLNLATKLAYRAVTGNAARDLVDQFMAKATKDEWNLWYRPILLKDMRCGVTDTIINKVLGKDHPSRIPVYECQLATDSNSHEDEMHGKKYLDIKLDGVRVNSFCYPLSVEQFSRNGKLFENFTSIAENLVCVMEDPDLRDIAPAGWMVDGEVVSKNFQALMSQARRKYDVDTSDANLFVFDMIPAEDFGQGICKAPQSTRERWLARLKEVLAKKKIKNIHVLDKTLVDLDTREGQKAFSQFNKDAVASGYEGIMIKDPDAPYECKRRRNWMKLKPFIEVSLKVIDVEIGTGKNAGRMGAIVCEGIDDGKQIKVNVGSGFSDEQRDDFWTHRKKVIGRVAEVRADVITQNKDGSYSLRFPRFLHFRGFEEGEKF